jgi:hypothetical protein
MSENDPTTDTDTGTEVFCIRWPRSLRVQIDAIAEHEKNNIAPVIRRLLSEGVERHQRAVKKRMKADGC